MIFFWNILCQLVLIRWIDAKGTYFHELSYIEIRPPGETNSTDFGFSMRYSNNHNKLVIGAPHHDRNGKVFYCPMKDIVESRTAMSTEIYIDMETLAGDYVREHPDQSFCLGASISVASTFILTCAPLWSTKNEKNNIRYGTYGTCFIILESNQTTRYTGLIEQLMEDPKRKKLKNKTLKQSLAILNGGSGWSTFVDESNNVSFISLAPFSPDYTGVGYMTTSPITPVQFSDILDDFSIFFKKIGTFTSGLFFGDKVSYAFTTRRPEMIGVVAFIQKTDGAPDYNVVTDRKWPSGKILSYKETNPGSMFGEALCAADINSDEFMDLLVGAPAYVKKTHREYDCGAIHIFLGGKVKMEERRTITSGVTGAHFGKTIATSDVDGDGLAEVFVSAPFEDSGAGAVYILNGKELKELVQVKSHGSETPVSDLKLTQRIQNKKYKSFGYSLQALPDIDGNGYNDIAIGAPNSGKVLVYRSIPVIHVDLSVEKPDYLRAKDMSFKLILTIKVTYPKNLETINEKLLGIMSIVGNGVSFKDGNYSSQFEIDISEKKPTYSKTVDVVMNNEDPATYLFNASIASYFDEYLKSEVFDKSRVQISPFSNANIDKTIDRRCTENCEPNLSAEILWTAGEGDYFLGSSNSETLMVVIRNNGNDTFDSCMKIYIKGAEVTKINAAPESGNWYHYRIPKPLSKNSTRLFEVTLDMSALSNFDKKLEVKVNLYNICDQKIDKTAEKDFRFVLNTDPIYIDGLSSERNVTDAQILDLANETITDYHVYTVINNSTVTWMKMMAKIIIPKKQVIKSYTLSTVQTVSCSSNDSIDTIYFICFFDLKQQPMKFLFTLHLAKEKFVDSLQNGNLNVTSNFTLELNGEQKMKEITTTLHYKVEVSWGQNTTLIIACAACLAVIIIALLVFGLYKCGFFKNPEKEKLENLKKEIIKQSIKRPNPNEDPIAQKSQEEKDHQGRSMETIPERKEEVDGMSEETRISGMQRTNEEPRQSVLRRTSVEHSGPSTTK